MDVTTALRRATVALAASAALSGGLLSTGSMAQAAPAMPASATGCSGNVCMYLSGNAGGTVLVQAWARNTTFTGQFHLTGPGVNWYSADQAWQGGKGNFASHSWYTASGGQVCVGAYSDGGTYQGTACENLS